MIVTSIINYKGGVGKTTITANLAAELGARGLRVLAIDLDPQANLTFSFISVEEWENRYNQRTIKAWFDALVNHGDIPDLQELIITPAAVNAQGKSSVDLICSHLGLINVDVQLAVMLYGTNPREQRRRFLEVYCRLAKGLRTRVIENQYDLVLIDCPPNFNIVTKNALVASNNYVIPAKPDYLSTLGIRELQKNIKDMVVEYNKYRKQTDAAGRYPKVEPELLGIIFNMVSFRNGEALGAEKQFIRQVQSDQLPVFETLIRENKTVYSEAPRDGVPVVLKPGMSGPTYGSIKQELIKMAEEFRGKAALA